MLFRSEIGDTLKKLVIFDRNVVRYSEDRTSIYFDEFICLGDNAHAETSAKIRRNEAIDGDIAMIVYTSGTTGEPKGVILTHANLRETMRIHDIRLPMVNDHDLSMCFLPLVHIFEKGWACFCLYKGVRMAINRYPKEIQKTLPEIRPTLMCNVPRFWEKVYGGVQEKIEQSPQIMKRLFHAAIETGRRYTFDYCNIGRKPPLGLMLKYHLYDKTLFTMVKKTIGLQRGALFPVAGAPLADNPASQ